MTQQEDAAWYTGLAEVVKLAVCNVMLSNGNELLPNISHNGYGHNCMSVKNDAI